MSTANDETRFDDSLANCRRCGKPGHWAADSDNCPWMIKAATMEQHLARIDNLKMRFLNFELTPHQKTGFIRYENELWKGKAA